MNNQTLNDLSLIFCTNEPAYVDGVPIYPIPIKKIAELGYKRFRSGMSLLCMTADDVNEIASNDISKYGVFMYLVCTAIKAPEMMETLIFWLSQLTHSQITFSRSERANRVSIGFVDTENSDSKSSSMMKRFFSCAQRMYSWRLEAEAVTPLG